MASGIEEKLKEYDETFQRRAVDSYVRIPVESIPEVHPVAVFSQFYHQAAKDGVISRECFDPSDHTQILPWLQLFEQLADGKYLTRVMGTGVANVVGADRTGLVLDDYLAEDFLEQRVTEFEDSHNMEQPIYSSSVVAIPGREFIEIYRGCFPVLKGDVKMILLVIAPRSTTLRRARL